MHSDTEFVVGNLEKQKPAIQWGETAPRNIIRKENLCATEFLRPVLKEIDDVK